MAYVLGVIYADGCLVEHANGYHCLNITSKDLSWLEQIKGALQAAQKISRKQRGYQIQIRNQVIYRQPLKLGLTPRKSLTLTLPIVPAPFAADFARGYFDGDGTVWYWRDPRWRHPFQLKASFYSGSRTFLVEMRQWLQRQATLSAGSLMKRCLVAQGQHMGCAMALLTALSYIIGCIKIIAGYALFVNGLNLKSS